MTTDAGQLAAGLARVAEAIASVDVEAAAVRVAAGIAAASPVRTGNLRAKVSTTGPVVTIAAPYAAPVAARNPFISKGIEAATTAAADAAFNPIETALDAL